MRYIVIPTLIIIYLIWTYYSILDIIKSNNRQIECKENTIYWVTIHVVILLGSVLTGFAYLCINYW